MAVDVKVIRVYLWRFSILFAGICLRFAQKHPCISSTLLSFFFLHVFFPFVFRLLIYSSPVIIGAYAYRKNVTKAEHPEAPVRKKYDQTNDAKNEVHVAKKSKEFGKPEYAETEDDTWSKHYGESESETQEDMRKAVEWTEQDERNLMDLGTSETERDKRLESLIQKRRARKLLSMQVRNVIDIIRHPPNQIAPLVIARSTGPLNLINTLSHTDNLHMPGSAPSVLLPSRSPFDLPYDPFEERPDLTGDSSFEQEFATADHKEFCRHESFFYGGHSGTRQDGNSLNSFMNAEKKRTERQRFSRFRSYIDRGSYETISSELEHELLSCGDMVVTDSGREQQSSEQTLKTDSVTSEDNTKSENNKTEKSDSEYLYAERYIRPGTEGTDSFLSGKNMSDNQVESAKSDSNRNQSSEDLSSYLHKSMASVQETAANEARENGHVRAPLCTSSKDLFNVHKRVLHTPAHSIASDLVVEVSETGSPPRTLSPPAEDSTHYDGDVERDISSGSEDMSMHVYRMEEHGTRSLEGQERVPEPEVVELEEEVVDEYEHTSPTSSDDNSSYENVVHHLTEKLNARRVSNNVIMGTPEEPCNPAEICSEVQVQNILSNQTNPLYGASESAENNERNSPTTDHMTPELNGDSSKQEISSTEEEGSSHEEQGSSSTQVAENVDGDTDIRTSDDVALAAEQQVQAIEEVPEATPPKSVSGNTIRLDSRPSDLTDGVSDVPNLENSTPSMLDSESSQHAEVQNARPPPSESNSQQGNKDEGLDQIIESEASLNPSISEDNTECSVIHKPDEETRDVGVNQIVTDEISFQADADEVSQKVEEIVSKTTEGAEGNPVKLQGDQLVTGMDPVGETRNLKFAEDEKGTVLMNTQAESSLSSTEALPLSNILHSDNEFNGISEERHDPDLKGGSSTAEASKQNAYTDLRTLGEPLTTSASSIDTPGGNLDDTSVKSIDPPPILDSQSEAPSPDMDTELHIHHITETCM